MKAIGRLLRVRARFRKAPTKKKVTRPLPDATTSEPQPEAAPRQTQFYTVYALALDEQRLALEFQSIDSAIKCCFFLTAEGYRLEKVTLPDASEVDGKDILEAMSAGISAARLRLTSG